MRDSRWLLAVAVVVSVTVRPHPATAGMLSDIALAGHTSPNPALLYVGFGNPQVGGAGIDPRIVVFAKTRSSSLRRHCLFKLDSAGNGTELACLREASPGSGAAYQKFIGASVNARNGGLGRDTG